MKVQAGRGRQSGRRPEKNNARLFVGSLNRIRCSKFSLRLISCESTDNGLLPISVNPAAIGEGVCRLQSRQHDERKTFPRLPSTLAPLKRKKLLLGRHYGKAWNLEAQMNDGASLKLKSDREMRIAKEAELRNACKREGGSRDGRDVRGDRIGCQNGDP